MNLKEYLSKKGKAPKEQTKEWLPFCNLDITTGYLWAGDPYIANAEDGCVVKVPRGRYAVEGIGLASGRYRFVAKLRARLESANNPSTGKELGETGTDSAMIGICDIKAFDKACGPESGDKVQQAIEAQTRGGFGVITLKNFPGAVMPFVPTGSDGVGPVIALMLGRKCVGIELSFMGDEGGDGNGPAQESKAVSLLGNDSPGFITRRIADGEEASFWAGGELRPGVKFSLWSSASRGPVEYQIRASSGAILKDWSSMKKHSSGGASFGAVETLPQGKYEVDFRIGELVFSGLKITVT